MPLISVVWNNNGEPAQAEKSIQSVLSSTDAEIELLISKNTNECLKVWTLDAHGNTVTVIPEEDETISNYRNNAIKRAKGKYICFLSAPHQFGLNKMKQAEYLEQHSEVTALFGGETIINSEEETLRLPGFVETDPGYIPFAIRYGYMMSLYSMMFLRERIVEGKCEFDASEDSDCHFIERVSKLYSVSGIQGESIKLLSEKESIEVNEKQLEPDPLAIKEIMALSETSFVKGFYARLAYRNSLIKGLSDKGEIRERIETAGKIHLCSSGAWKPKVSVIIPTYNRSGKVTKAIESVLNQTYDNIEIIVVDDCSTDETAEVVEQYVLKSNKVKYYRLEKNSGPSCARNCGAGKAQGDYIAFHDDDDEWFCDKLDIQMSLMVQDRSIDMTFGQMIRYSDDKLLNIVLSDFDWYNQKDKFFQEELKNNYIGAPTIVIRKEKFFLLGGFCECLSAMEDWEFAIRASKECRIEYVHTPLMEVNVLQNSVTRNTTNNAAALQYIGDRYYMYAEDGAFLIKLYRKHLREMLKQCKQPATEWEIIKKYVSTENFDRKLAEELYFDVDDIIAFNRLDTLEKTTETQQDELKKQYDRNNGLMAELQSQTDRNGELMAELQRQVDRNGELMAELQRQVDRNDELMTELQRQYDRNAALVRKLKTL